MFNFDKIKELRKKNKITQSDLAKYAQISQRQISSYENGKEIPSIQTIANIANYFNVSIEYLLGIATNNVDEKAWMQKCRKKRLEIFKNPEGEFEYIYYFNGSCKKSIIKYSFGIFTSEKYKEMHKVMFKPSSFMSVDNLDIPTRRFLFVEEIDGEFFKCMLNSKNEFEFWSFVNFLDKTFFLGNSWDIDHESGEPAMQLLINNSNEYLDIPEQDKLLQSVNKYSCISVSRGCPVRSYMIDVIYTAFLNIYLSESVENKINFLVKEINVAFMWL